MYPDYNDNELVYMIKEDNNTFDIILEKYNPLISNLSFKYIKLAKKYGYDYEDLMQISRIVLYDAIENYRDDANALFYTYLKTCIEYKFKNELRNQQNLKRVINSKTISYDSNIDNSDYRLIDVLENPNSVNPIIQVIDHNFEISYRKFLNSLPVEESAIFELRGDGLTILEISNLLNMNKSDVYKLLNKAKLLYRKEFV